MGMKVSLGKESAKHDCNEEPLHDCNKGPRIVIELSTDMELLADDKESLADVQRPLDYEQPQGCHSIFCWSVKVCCGTILIASLFICTLYELQPWFAPQLSLAKALIIVGGLSAIFHYRKLEAYSCKFAQPDTLVTDRGLYRFIRHPMYFSDSLMCIGLFLLFPTIPTAFVLAVATVALIRQSKEEDRYLAQRFNQQFTGWYKRTKLIIPLVY